MTIAEANQPFANGMKILIKEKGLKKAHIAKQVRCTPQELSDMLCGRRIIKACDILKLAQAIKVQIDDIYMIGKGESDYD